MLNKDGKPSEEALSSPKCVNGSSVGSSPDKCGTANGAPPGPFISFGEGEQLSCISNTSQVVSPDVCVTVENDSDTNVAEVINGETCTSEKNSHNSKSDAKTSETMVMVAEARDSEKNAVMEEVKISDISVVVEEQNSDKILAVENSKTVVAEECKPDMRVTVEVMKDSDKSVCVVKSAISTAANPVKEDDSWSDKDMKAGGDSPENVDSLSTVAAATISEPFIEISDDGSWDTKHQHELEVAQTAKESESSESAAPAEKPLQASGMEAGCDGVQDLVTSPECLAAAHDNANVLDAVADLCVGLKTLDLAKPYEGEQPEEAPPSDSSPGAATPFRFGKFPLKDVVYDSILENKNKTKTYWEQRMLCVVDGECVPKVVDAVAKSPAVAKIALELREMREREEELRRARLAHNDSCSEYGSEDSMVSPPGYSHQRTDSMSSGHSSGSDFGRRRVTVKPLDEPDSETEMPVYKRTQKETPIEREIRLAREREEELRREKGLPPLNSNSAPKSDFRLIHKTLHLNEQQNSQPPQPATNRIQQEIDEATQREKELKQANGIHTFEENNAIKVFQTADALKNFTDEKESDQNNLLSSNLSESFNDGETFNQSVSTKRSQLAGSTYTNSVFASPTQRISGSGGQKGLMQRFYASHGRIKVVSPTRNMSPSVSPVLSQPIIQRKVLDISTGADSQDSDEEPVRTPIRRGYQSAEEKIQAELQEMQKREEELRLQRAKLFAQSQPNLLSIGSIEEEEIHHINGDREKQTLQTAQSIPNLLESDDSLDASQESASQKFQKNSPRKRSALIAEWESRIQKNLEH